MMDYPNGGFCFVDLSGYTMTEIDDGGVTVPGFHDALERSIKNGKVVIVYAPQELGSEENISAMTPCSATVAAYSNTTEIAVTIVYSNSAITFVVSTADLVTIGG